MAGEYKNLFKLINLTCFMNEDESGILGDFDYQYISRQFRRAKEHKWIERYVDGIEVLGLENLKQLRGRQFVCFSNHKSHFDYIGLGYLFLENLPVDNFPRIIAGKNLDSRILALAGLDFSRMGAFFIDREEIADLMKKRKRGVNFKEEIERLRWKVDGLSVGSLQQGKSSVGFLEGGRNYSGRVLERVKPGLLNHVVQAHNDPFISVDPLVVPCAVDYDRVIEARFFPVLDFCKNHFRPGYYAADAAAFLVRPFLREGRGSMYVAFSEPRRLSEIVSGNLQTEQVLQLRDYLTGEIRRLHDKIQERK